MAKKFTIEKESEDGDEKILLKKHGILPTTVLEIAQSEAIELADDIYKLLGTPNDWRLRWQYHRRKEWRQNQNDKGKSSAKKGQGQNSNLDMEMSRL